MIKAFASLLIALALSAPACAADNLKSELTGKTQITADVVTVADLFTNSGPHAGHVLAPAPVPGTKLVLSQYDLLRVAKAFHLNWSVPAALAPLALERAVIAATDVNTVTIPVLKYPTAANSIIKADDLIEIAYPEKQLRGETVLSKNELVGMITRRSMQANQSIGRQDIIQPLMVKRNEVVTVTYQNGPVVLSTKARSLGNGSQGDTVMLMNINSKKPFTAKVTGPQQAEVNVTI